MNHKPVFVIRPAHLVACLIGLLMWALILAPAWASGSGDDLTNISKNSNTNTNNLTGGDITGGNSSNVIGGDDNLALAFAHALGDVDINDCLASTQWGTIIVSRQKVIANLWCMGEVYDAKGMFDLAAKARCSVAEIRAWFSDDLACERANTWSGFVVITPPSTGDVSETDDDDDDHAQDVHRQEVADALARMDHLEKRLDQEAAARRRAVKAGQAAREKTRADNYEFATQQLEQFVQMVEPATTCTNCKTGNE